MNKKSAYIVGIITLLIGLWGFYDRFAYGHDHAAYGSVVVWGLWVALYFLFGGLAVGCFLWASLDLLFEIPACKGTGVKALWAALITLTAALIAIAFDLGHMERFWKVLLQPNLHAGVAEDAWGYTIFGGLTAIALFRAVNQKGKDGVLKVIMVLGLVVSLYVAGAPGKLMGVNAARSFWHAGMLPVQFLFFALATGAALLMVILTFADKKEKLESSLSILHPAAIILLGINLYFTWSYFSQGIAGGMPGIMLPAQEIVSGQYSGLFWGVQIMLGGIVPIVVLALNGKNNNIPLSGLMGLCILLGNGVSRYLILVAGQKVEMLPGMSQAVHGPGLTLTYSPSTSEWAVASGLVGLVILGLLIGADLLLPMFTKSRQEA